MIKKTFAYSNDSTITIVEGLYNYDESTTKILSKNTYSKSKFFVNHAKILTGLFSNLNHLEIEFKTNLVPESEIYKLFLDFASKNTNVFISGKNHINQDNLKETFLSLIDSNFKNILFLDKVLEKRILSELKLTCFEDISDHSFLCFYHACVPQEMTIYQPSLSEQLKSKEFFANKSIDPLFGGYLTNRGLKGIFL